MWLFLYFHLTFWHTFESLKSFVLHDKASNLQILFYLMSLRGKSLRKYEILNWEGWKHQYKNQYIKWHTKDNRTSYHNKLYLKVYKDFQNCPSSVPGTISSIFRTNLFCKISSHSRCTPTSAAYHGWLRVKSRTHVFLSSFLRIVHSTYPTLSYFQSES